MLPPKMLTPCLVANVGQRVGLPIGDIRDMSCRVATWRSRVATWRNKTSSVVQTTFCSVSHVVTPFALCRDTTFRDTTFASRHVATYRDMS